MRARVAFRELAAREIEHAFSAIVLDARAGVYLGVDANRRPALFIREAAGISQPTLRTQYLSLTMGRDYRVTQADGSDVKSRFNVLSCESSAPADSESFLAVCDAFLAGAKNAQFSGDQLRSLFISLVRLFAVRPESDVTSQRQGLWGELFVMSRLRGFPFWAPFWHEETTSRFDFTGPGRWVEVKTALGKDRIHRFAHAQLYTAHDEEIAVASLLLLEDKSGLSLRNLVTECRAELRGSPYYMKLERAVRSAQMEDPSAAGPAFSATHAESELAWFRAEDVPHFRLPEPQGVSETHYRANLHGAPRISSEDLGAWLNKWRDVPASEVGGRTL